MGLLYLAEATMTLASALFGRGNDYTEVTVSTA